MDFSERYTAGQEAVNSALDEFFVENCAQGELLEAMRYSLLSGGKRIRPILLLAFCEGCGGTAESAMDAACAIEMLHTYSLIHDDLPCMDDDELRRGRPTCHKVYGETTAILAGDALQAAAFRVVLGGSADAAVRAAMAAVLAEAAGERGMCGGQYLDTAVCEDNDEEALLRIHALKTGALLQAACVMGVLCGKGSEAQLAAARDYAQHLGLAFQIRDDILDETSTAETLGKSVHSDSENGKITFATLLGVEGCQKLVRSHTDAACAALGQQFSNTEFLCALAERLAERES